jgi:hypothetical protein
MTSVSGPAGADNPGTWPTEKGNTVDTTESSAPHAHPSTDDHDDTVEAHYACLERPCACLEGWVFVGYVDEDGEEREKPPTVAAVAQIAHADLHGERGSPNRLSPFHSMLLSNDTDQETLITRWTYYGSP